MKFILDTKNCPRAPQQQLKYAAELLYISYTSKDKDINKMYNTLYQQLVIHPQKAETPEYNNIDTLLEMYSYKYNNKQAVQQGLNQLYEQTEIATTMMTPTNSRKRKINMETHNKKRKTNIKKLDKRINKLMKFAPLN